MTNINTKRGLRIQRTRLIKGMTTIASILTILGSCALNPESFLHPLSVSAADPKVSVPACRNAIHERLGQQTRLLRRVWLGESTARNAPLNAVRYTEDGTAWIRVQENTWRTATLGFENTTISDAQIDQQTEWEGMNDREPVGRREYRLGVFQQTQMLTSQFVPDLTQSMRAFQCRLEMVCEGVRLSFSREPLNDQGLLSVVTPGCDTLVMQPIAECRFDATGTVTQNTLDGIAASVVETECAPFVSQLVNREAAFLRVLVAYDSAVRTAYQLGGSIDMFLQGLRGDFLAPLEQTIPFLTLFDVPCFTNTCNE